MNFNNLDQLYRSVIMDHYKNPRNKGVLDNGSMTVDMNNPTCGDRIRLTFDIEDGIIKDAKFEGEGCSISMASASMMTQAVKGHSLSRSLPLFLLAIFSLVIHSAIFLITISIAMILVQFLDAIVGYKSNDVFKTYGPLATSVVNLILLIVFLF